MQISKYVLVDQYGETESAVYDSYQEAEREAGSTHAVIEYQFEYADSELVYTPDGSGTWPPAVAETETGADMPS